MVEPSILFTSLASTPTAVQGGAPNAEQLTESGPGGVGNKLSSAGAGSCVPQEVLTLHTWIDRSSQCVRVEPSDVAQCPPPSAPCSPGQVHRRSPPARPSHQEEREQGCALGPLRSIPSLEPPFCRRWPGQSLEPPRPEVARTVVPGQSAGQGRLCVTTPAQMRNSERQTRSSADASRPKSGSSKRV